MQGIELTPEYSVETVRELGAIAGAEGFDTVFVSSHYNNRDPFLVLGEVASVADVRIGPGVANPYQSHPVVLASQMATLAEIADAGVVFGLGAGDRSTLRNLGIRRDRPLARVRETIEVARALWAGERVDHDGTFVADDAGLNFVPEGDIPIYVGAQGPQMLRMAAQCADGVLVNVSHPADFAWARDQLGQGFRGRESGGEFESVGYVSVSVAEDAAWAREAARPPVSFIAAGASSRLLDRHEIDRSRAEEIGSLIGAGRFSDAFERVTDGMLDAFCIAGAPAHVADELSEVLSFVDGVVAGAPLGPDQYEAVRLLGDVFSRIDRE